MWLRIILGVTYTAMAAGQVASWPRMPDILDAYDAAPAAALPWLAGALIIGELVSGVWLAARPRSRGLAPVWMYTAVTLAWTILGLQAQLRGLQVGGHRARAAAQPTPLARQIKDRVAFWRGVQVDVVPAGQPRSTREAS